MINFYKQNVLKCARRIWWVKRAVGRVQTGLCFCFILESETLNKVLGTGNGNLSASTTAVDKISKGNGITVSKEEEKQEESEI